MNAHQLTGANISSAPTAANLFTLAVARTEVGATNQTFVFYASEQATGQTVLTASNAVAGDDVAVPQVTPDFFPYATAGAECGAIVTGLSWAEKNLSQFEYILLNKTNSTYFVTGILNSSKTEFNDPFDSAGGVTAASCWAGGYVKNLFA